jgi:FtsP/CotA-like multicopper oxidase with cupredoxin domain
MSSQRLSSSAFFDGQVSRRTFVKGLAVGGAAAGLGLWRAPAFAQGDPPVAWTSLCGTEFDLRIGETPMNFTGTREWRSP